MLTKVKEIGRKQKRSELSDTCYLKYGSYFTYHKSKKRKGGTEFPKGNRSSASGFVF